VNKRVIKIGWIVLAALLCLSLVLVPGCTVPAEEEEEEEEVSIPYKNDGIFVQETIGEIDSLDPAWAYDQASNEQVSYIYETLVQYNSGEPDQFDPVLASDLGTMSADGKQMRFTIRSEATFSNGDPVTPEDVEYSFERAMVQDPLLGPIYMFYTPLLGVEGTGSWQTESGELVVTFDQIDNAVEVEGNQVVFNFVAPFPATTWRQILCGSWSSIVNKQWCIDHGDWDGTEATWLDYNNPEKEDMTLFKQAMGSGPWVLDNWDPAIEIVLAKNENYWGGAENVPFDYVITKVVDEWTTRKLDFLNGEADCIYVPRENKGEIEDIADVQGYKDLADVVVYGFNFGFDIQADTYIGSGQLDGNGIPTDFFTDVNVRQGFCYAFDYDTYIQDVWLGEAKQLGSPICEGLLYYDPTYEKYTYDVDEATARFQAAWNGELWEKGMKFTLCYNTGNVMRKAACDILAQSLADINPKFQVSVLAMAWPTFLDASKAHALACWLVGWGADYPDPDNFITPYMCTYGAIAGGQGYGSAELDDLIAEARTETDSTVRGELYAELAQIFHDDAPGILLGQPTGRRWFTKYIHGYYFNTIIPGAPGPLWDMWKSES
jgi:peptide/nickel transport system substrate-binding protein